MRRATIALLAGSLIFIAACQTAPVPASRDAAAGDIRAILQSQQAAWNAGDIEDFMQGYWQSPDLRFASGGNVVRGYQPTLERYQRNYSSRGQMGTLGFEDLEVEMLSPDAAVVHGAWKLMRDGDTPGGLFTLIVRRIDGQWKIVSDTTTSAG